MIRETSEIDGKIINSDELWRPPKRRPRWK